MMKKRYRVAVIGAGVVGTTSAFLAQQQIPDAEITIISEKFSPDTTGDGSAGLWGPYLLGNTPEEKVRQWAGSSYRMFHHLWKEGLSKEAGISMMPFRRVNTEKTNQDPPLSDELFGYRHLSEEELQQLGNGRELAEGYEFTTFTCEPSKFIPFLTNIFLARGGKIIQRKIDDLSTISDMYNAFILCPGLNARYLLNDQAVYPIRGQIAKVHAPWVNHVFVDDSDDGSYYIPNQQALILGGTHQEHDWNTKVDPTDTSSIWQGCQGLLPQLRAAVPIKDWVGLRPARRTVRLEREDLKLPNGNVIKVVHNYGHGGSGITLSWGCAEEAVTLLQQTLILDSSENKHQKILKSHL